MLARVVLFAALLAGISATVDDPEFQNWLSEHQLKFDDEESIYPVWKKNAEFVQHHNSLGLSHTVSLNKFAHLEPEDLLKSNPVVFADTADTGQTVSEYNDPLPPSVDWRKEGAVTPVMNQGQEGSAISFAVVDSIASFNFVENKVLKMPSVAEYEDCCSPVIGGAFGFGVQDYFCIVYHLGGLACDYKPDQNRTCRSKDFKPCVVIKGGRQVETGPDGNETILAMALVKQPLAVAIDSNHSSFKLYHSGIYYNANCTSDFNKLDHKVLLVGYGSENGEDYWIVKNSWGEDWGMNGYIKMSRNKRNNCGIATNALYPY